MNQLFSLTTQKAAARAIAVVTILALILSAFPAAFFVANAADTPQIEPQETGETSFYVNEEVPFTASRNGFADDETLTVHLSSANGGAFSDGNGGGNCTGNFDETSVTIAWNKSNKAFCYQNANSGVDTITATFVSEQSGEEVGSFELEIEALNDAPEYFCKAEGNGGYHMQTLNPVEAQQLNDGENAGLMGSGVNENNIIPPFGDFAGYNWNDDTEEIFDNDCETEADTPEVDFCDPSQKPGGVDIAQWHEANDFDGDTCFEYTEVQQCGSLDMNLTDKTGLGFGFDYVIGTEVPADWQDGMSFPVTFDEDDYGGSVDVTYYMTGPESDWFVDSDIPNYWALSGVTVTVDTDCEKPVEPPRCENLLTNGSFEEPEVENSSLWQKFEEAVTGWVTQKVSDDTDTTLEIHRGWSGNDAAHGEQYAELDGDHSTKVSQTVATIPGAEYELSWAFAPRHNIAGEQNQLSVLLNDSVVAAEGPTTGSAGLDVEDWTLTSIPFTADSESTTITFADAGPSNSFGTFLDDAQLCLVSKPELCHLPYLVTFAVDSDEDTYSTTPADGFVIEAVEDGYQIGLYDDGRDGVYHVQGTITFPAGTDTSTFSFTEAGGTDGLEQNHLTYPDVVTRTGNTIEFDLFVNGADDIFTITDNSLESAENCDIEPPQPEQPMVCSADGEVIDYTQGNQNDGGPVDANRSDVAAVEAGVAVYSNFYGKEPSWSTDDFFSLGINGELVYEFTTKIAVDKPGDDIAIWEITGGNSGQSAEKVDVYLSEDGVNFELAEQITGDGAVDIADTSFTEVRFVKLVDQSNGVQGGNGDGYDLDAITILEGACEDPGRVYSCDAGMLFLDTETDAPDTMSLYTVNEGDGAATFWAEYDIELHSAMAIADDATIYAIEQGTGDLVTLDDDEGTVSVVGGTGINNEKPVAMEIAPNGTLYVMTQNSDTLYEIDMSDGSATELEELDLNVEGGDIVFDAGLIYYVKNTGEVYAIDSDDSYSETLAGTLNVGGEKITSAATKDGTHYAFTRQDTMIPFTLNPFVEGSAVSQTGPYAWGDGSYCPAAPVDPEPTATVVADKIVCTDEADLPNWGAGGANITANTAADWVSDHKSCKLVEDWEFEWAPMTAADPGDTLTGPAGGEWTTFTGTTEIPLSALDDDNRVWMREVLQDGYIPFTYEAEGNKNTDNVSAEFYCHTDVLNYDNIDRIDGVQEDGEYYCVAFNVPVAPEQCTLEAYSDTNTVVIESNVFAVETYEHDNWADEFEDAQWIWTTEYVENPGEQSTSTFMETFEVQNPTAATLEIWADNWYKVYVNGELVADRAGQNSYQDFQKQTFESEILDELKSGSNTLLIEVINTGAEDSNQFSNPAGLLYKLTVEGDENSCELTTDLAFDGSLAITDPLTDGQVLSGTHTFKADYQDADDVEDTVYWAIRAGSCNGPDMAGNAPASPEPHNLSTYDPITGLFSTTVDMSGWSDGDYCLVVNPKESGGHPDLRDTRTFILDNKDNGGEEGPEGIIVGVKWNDLNGDGVQDDNEPLLSGWTIEATNGDTVLTAITDGSGAYEIAVPAGEWTISEQPQSGWTQTGTEFFDDPSKDLTCVFTVGSQDQFRLAQNVYAPVVPEYRCDFGNQENPTITTITTTNSRTYGTRTSRRATPQPLVLGESVSQCEFLKEHMQMGTPNDRFEVMKLQMFLSIIMGYEQPVTGFFGAMTDANVKRFQATYSDEILNPWNARGIVPHTNPTGFVYKLTKWKINDIVCPGWDPYPSFEGEDLTHDIAIDVAPIPD